MDFSTGQGHGNHPPPAKGQSRVRCALLSFQHKVRALCLTRRIYTCCETTGWRNHCARLTRTANPSSDRKWRRQTQRVPGCKHHAWLMGAASPQYSNSSRTSCAEECIDKSLSLAHDKLMILLQVYFFSSSISECLNHRCSCKF